MKKEYPLYNKGDTNILEGKLKGKDKEVFGKFMTFVSANAGKLKQTDRRKDILQIRDIIEKEFSSWNYEDVVQFVALLKEADREVWTKKGTLTTLSIFIKWYCEDWSKTFRNLDIIKKVQRQLVPDNSKKYNEDKMPTVEEIDKMIRSAEKLWHKLWISMIAEAGIPFAVQSKLTWENLKIDHPEDNITTLTYFREKNKNEFIFPLGKTTTYYLKQWQQEYPYPNIKKSDLIFPSPNDRDSPVAQPTIHTMLNTISKKSGVNKHMYQYLIRHRVLSDNYGKNGMTEEVHRKLFGHKPGSKMTKTYSHQDNDKTLQKALELLHKVKPLTRGESTRLERMKKEMEDLKKENELSLKDLRESLEKETENRRKTDEMLDKIIFGNPKIVKAIEKLVESGKWSESNKELKKTSKRDEGVNAK